jgi:Pyruvate phosphate dikinase, AMP/ATP-binding domain
VSALAPLVMALDDPGAAPGVVGGKGASLARLARAGFRVPPGFHVTTSAYLDFIDLGGLREPVLTAVAAVDVSDVATFDAAAARIGDLLAGQPMCSVPEQPRPAHICRPAQPLNQRAHRHVNPTGAH